MALRSVSYFKADTIADLAACDADCVVYVEENHKQYIFDGEAWQTPEDAASAEAFPVGSIFISVDQTNPGSVLGYGTWAAFGPGRTLVGFDNSQTEFDAAEKTGGEKTHVLTVGEMPGHTHAQDAHNHTQNAHTHVQDAHTHVQNAHNHAQSVNTATTGGLSGYTPDTSTNTSATSGYSTANATAVNQNATAVNQNATAINNAATATNQSAGGGAAHNNLQPFIVCYFWKRTA
jgi:microcystin-dependent protein